jgi:hypothetical protein
MAVIVEGGVVILNPFLGAKGTDARASPSRQALVGVGCDLWMAPSYRTVAMIGMCGGR